MAPLLTLYDGLPCISRFACDLSNRGVLHAEENTAAEEVGPVNRSTMQPLGAIAVP